jgi:membrane protease YdiL (CAAX protease family)
LHLIVFGLLVPIAAWRSAKRIDRVPLPPRKRYFISVLVQQGLFGAFSLWVAHLLGIDLFPPIRLSPFGLLAGAALLAGAVVLLYPRWVRAVEQRSRRVYLVSPRDGRERALWLGISLAAGIIEEISYRGVLYWIVTAVTGSAVAGVVLCSLAFGLGHLVQGWAAAAIITGFAAGFHGLVIATGSLYLAMAVHICYDVIAGLSYGRLAERLGLPAEPPPPVIPAIDSPAQTPS